MEAHTYTHLHTHRLTYMQTYTQHSHCKSGVAHPRWVQLVSPSGVRPQPLRRVAALRRVDREKGRVGGRSVSCSATERQGRRRGAGELGRAEPIRAVLCGSQLGDQSQ